MQGRKWGWTPADLALIWAVSRVPWSLQVPKCSLETVNETVEEDTGDLRGYQNLLLLHLLLWEVLQTARVHMATWKKHATSGHSQCSLHCCMTRSCKSWRTSPPLPQIHLTRNSVVPHFSVNDQFILFQGRIEFSKRFKYGSTQQGCPANCMEKVSVSNAQQAHRIGQIGNTLQELDCKGQFWLQLWLPCRFSFKSRMHHE